MLDSVAIIITSFHEFLKGSHKSALAVTTSNLHMFILYLITVISDHLIE